VKKTLGAALLAMALVAPATPAAAITYGQPTGTAHGNVGSMVAEIDGQYYQICSGTLIKQGVLLTASHCLVGNPADWDLYVSFAPDLASPAPLIPVTGVVVHPDFGRNMANEYDVGALLFAPSASSGLTPAPVAPVGYLSDMSQRQLRAATFTAVGYGTIRVSRKTGWQGILDNTERRSGDQTALSLQKAWLTLSMNEATGDAGTCYGDSGGPHFQGGYVVSVTVTGDAMCKATDKTYRLDTPWVHQFLADNDLLP
jgi:secreted trypsin-like serine protease